MHKLHPAVYTIITNIYWNRIHSIIFDTNMRLIILWAWVNWSDRLTDEYISIYMRKNIKQDNIIN